MGRRPKGERVLGPYKCGRYFQVVLVAGDGTRELKYFEDEGEAAEFKGAVEAEIHTEDLTTEQAIELYEQHLRAKGNKENSIKRTMWALRGFFSNEVPLWSLTERRCRRLYAALTDKYAADSHRNALAETKTFMRWVVKERRWLPRSPVENISGIGRRSKRKPQLRVKEARAWFKKAVELAESGDEGAVAALMTLLLGMRASEIVSRRERDLDEEEAPGDLLWIPDSKTDAGRRTLEVPAVLRAFLVALVEGKKPDDPIFLAKRASSGFHDRDWPRAQVRRICRLAKVAEVTAHGMRGAMATLALERGSAGHLVAATLGHEDPRTTIESYAEAGSAEAGQRRRGLKVLNGGRR